jgi:hypothetical protein
MTPFLMFATVMQAIIIKAPTIRPSLHDSNMYASGVAPSRQWPSKLAFRRTRLLGCSELRSSSCNGAILHSFGYTSKGMVCLPQALIVIMASPCLKLSSWSLVGFPVQNQLRGYCVLSVRKKKRPQRGVVRSESQSKISADDRHFGAVASWVRVHVENTHGKWGLRRGYPETLARHKISLDI